MKCVYKCTVSVEPRKNGLMEKVSVGFKPRLVYIFMYALIEDVG